MAAAVNHGFSSDQAAAEHVRKITLIPFFGARGSGVVSGICDASVSAAVTAALAVATPLLLAAAAEALAAGEVDELLPLPDDEPHADAVATHATARTPIHAFCSFMASPAWEVGTARRPWASRP
jgi:hypothetical protein